MSDPQVPFSVVMVVLLGAAGLFVAVDPGSRWNVARTRDRLLPRWRTHPSMTLSMIGFAWAALLLAWDVRHSHATEIVVSTLCGLASGLVLATHTTSDSRVAPKPPKYMYLIFFFAPYVLLIDLLHADALHAALVVFTVMLILTALTERVFTPKTS